ncbi:MAG: M1 family peptidase, partial [Chitinophagaceae bacterium]
TGNGMRTDTWKMSQPHAPYLLFMGVGSFEVVKDRYKGKDVTYYVEKEYAPVARRIFGYTPEMMALYSRLTGVEFPWPKYAQIVGRDYIFGAMENTTATLHGDDANQDARSLVDGNEWELVIAHELFHQWTGDYVTTESWSNTTVNESFADYSEALWYEYKYGREAMQHQLYSDRRLYLSNKSLNSKKLVTFNYGNAFEMFDQVSYQKGGCILQMLRSFVGDSAFFRSIKLYLDTYKYKSAEAQQLRLAFEEVTGKDLNWFWNQWYYGSGHPVLDLSYQFDAATRKARLIVQQTQDGAPFTAPVVVAVHQGGKVKEHRVWIRNRTDTFSFDASARPDLINFDAENVLVAQKTDHKTPAEWQYLYGHGSYIDRREA